MPDKALAEVVQSTIAAYLIYITAIGKRYGHKIIVGGVPCTNIALDSLTAASVGQLVHLIRIFNVTLERLALAAGMDFLDIYALTDSGDGIANRAWYIVPERKRLKAIQHKAYSYFLSAKIFKKYMITTYATFRCHHRSCNSMKNKHN